ncbi:uncharacterized protein LOC119603611 [Lucilia sericata]|uniref:uncharacterized protein LOC119603611 n=1 Tax=Lucilia sericata TaxID=13632 RepID=UPI0018A8735A|nr:uncharacterized protein LOC119603611 [Lucilia sericata]
MVKNIIVGLVILGICWNVNGLTSGLSATANLADVILKSTYALESNPSLTAQCFQIYMPKINDLTQQYEQAYNGCLNLTTEAEEILKEQVQDDIDSIQNVTKTMCSNFENCSLVTDSLYETFECYYNVAGNNIQSAFEVQNISKDKMKFVQIKEEYIMYNQTVCTDECSRVYVEETSKVHADLEACLAGKAPQETTTVAKPDIPVQPVTTAVPDVKVPETTKAPEVTTVKVETAPVITTTKIPNTY